MGMQRVASDISLQAIQAEPGLSKTSTSEASLNPTREESFAEEPAAQQNAVLEQFKHILLDQGIKEDVDYTEFQFQKDD
ncbi:hypothetical protein GCM10011318_11370 [Phaeocystidibacter marisrubri]|nr:hypothetical protein GCM10011318_11370 [Phaeocystidibacter marisrubri]